MKELKKSKRKHLSRKEKMRYKSLAAQLDVKLLAKRMELDQKIKDFEYNTSRSTPPCLTVIILFIMDYCHLEIMQKQRLET